MIESGTYETPCPQCKGKVQWTYYGLDCRGNSDSMVIECKKCGKTFDSQEWKDKK